LLLQTRTQTLDGTLPETFRKWYPAANLDCVTFRKNNYLSMG
jgi:hypothetical protein